MNKKSLKTLEYNKIIDMLTEYAVSDAAKSKAASLIPLTDEKQINDALTHTNDALSRLYAHGCPSFSGISDITESMKRLAIGSSLSMHELRVISSILTAASLHKIHYEDFSDSLTPYYDSLDSLSALNRQIQKCIISDEQMADDASSVLKDIRRQLSLADGKIHNELNKLIGSHRNYLQDGVVTTRQGHYCLPVKAEYRSQIPGMILDQSATGATIFVEPAAVIKISNDIRQLEIKEAEEIAIILSDLSREAALVSDQIMLDYTSLTELDFIFAKAQFARHLKATRPVINHEHKINIKKGRHPLIDPDSVVPIDIYLGDEFNLLIITGPNTGGKTVSLKTVGLLTLMAQAGLNIPADNHSAIAVFDDVFADIGDEQSIEQNLSTFSSHMTNTVNILKQANRDSLILFDEIGAGTDPTEGAALAVSILDFLHKNGITTMATTHYSEIKMYALSTDGVENACCEFDVASLRPTYRLLIGIPGKSNAFAISKKLGLPNHIINDASERINANDIHFEDLISDLENSRVTIEKEQKEINDYKHEIEQLKAELKDKNRRLDEKTDKIIRNANEKAAEILRDAKEYADQTIRVMNKHGMTVKELEKQRTAIRSKSNNQQEKLSVKNTVKAHKTSDINEFKIGIHVRIISMNMTGTVSTIPNSKGDLTVQVGSMTTKSNIKNLEILTGYKEPKSNTNTRVGLTGIGSGKLGGQGKIKAGKTASISPEINLIGMTVDEAVGVLDKYLDDAYLAGLAEVRIVHGKGTGALRNGVGVYLNGVPYVKSHRPGKIGEGDAGVTIVEFK